VDHGGDVEELGEKNMSTARIATIPDTHHDILQSTTLAVVTTLGPKGEPQSSPVWFGWDGQRLRFSHTKARQKYRNLVRDPRIAVCLVDTANPYRYVEIRGTVTIEEDPEKSFPDVMAKKYLGVDRYANGEPGEERVTVIVTPDHVNTMG
jgi:PPOX class probable F420-dependent enzyme